MKRRPNYYLMGTVYFDGRSRRFYLFPEMLPPVPFKANKRRYGR